MLKLQKTSLDQIISQEGTPLLVLDLAILRKNIQEFQALFSNFKIYYSTKTNPDPPVVDTALLAGLGFDAATLGEITYLIGRKVHPETILFTHPVKSVEEIKRAHLLGVAKFTFDNLDELKLLEVHAPRSDYMLRVLPHGNSSLYDYKDKFGSTTTETKKILEYAARKKIPIKGLSFMVGSQSMTVQPWIDTMKYCRKLIDDYYDRIPSLRAVNIGSGFPAQYGFEYHMPLLEIADAIQAECAKFQPDVEFYAEPGRVLVASAALLVTEVVKRATRNDKVEWLFTDASAYCGLVEILESCGTFKYRVGSLKSGLKRKYNIAGKTLDPDDVLAKEVKLPASIAAGDYIFIDSVGAYTSMFFTDYHFIKKPRLYFIDSEFDSNLEVATSRHAVSGIVAKRRFKKGELIFTVTGSFTKKRTRNSFQVGNRLHIEPTLFGSYLNHSCAPNAGVQTNEHGLLNIVAMNDIERNREVTVDYAMFEYELGEMAKVRCLCKARECRGKITGYNELSSSKRSEYSGFIADYLLHVSKPKTKQT